MSEKEQQAIKQQPTIIAPHDETLQTTFENRSSFIRSNYFRFLRFGSIDSSMLVISALFGLSLDSWLASKIGSRGYGPIIGACVGNVLSDAVAAIPEGSMASVGAFTGASLPMVPLTAFLLMRWPLSQRVKLATGAFSGVILVGAFTVEKLLEEKEEKSEDE